MGSVSCVAPSESRRAYDRGVQEPQVIDMERLRFSPTAWLFEGVKFGGIQATSFIVATPPGRGVGLHVHPYPEVFIVLKTLRWLTGSVVFIEPERSSTRTTRVSCRVAVAVAATSDVLAPVTRMNRSGTSAVAVTTILCAPRLFVAVIVGVRFFDPQ